MTYFALAPSSGFLSPTRHRSHESPLAPCPSNFSTRLALYANDSHRIAGRLFVTAQIAPPSPARSACAARARGRPYRRRLRLCTPSAPTPHLVSHRDSAISMQRTQALLALPLALYRYSASITPSRSRSSSSSTPATLPALVHPLAPSAPRTPPGANPGYVASPRTSGLLLPRWATTCGTDTAISPYRWSRAYAVSCDPDACVRSAVRSRPTTGTQAVLDIIAHRPSPARGPLLQIFHCDDVLLAATANHRWTPGLRYFLTMPCGRSILSPPPSSL
jgi:hypothetical protein